MKKFLTFFSILTLSACAGGELMETRISYVQKGENCVYTEKAGDKILKGDEEVGFRAIVSKTITYPDKKCAEIIDSDLKNGINKNHSVSYSSAMQILSTK